MIVAGVALGIEYGYVLLAGIVLVIAAPIYLSPSMAARGIALGRTRDFE
jgi:hypothetical protein